MWEDKAKRKEIFEDTMALINKSAELSAAVEESRKNTKFYSADEVLKLPEGGKEADITFSGERTYEAAIRLVKENPGKRVAVLNFASAINPGGGVVYGAGAQEECLCRTSTLYPLLNTAELRNVYYTPNKEHGDNLHTDAVIYTPDVVICKSDTNFPERIPEAEYQKVDVITCAAPNLNQRKTTRYSGDTPMVKELSGKEQYDLHYKRCKHILSAAAVNQADIVVLGAFGCGAFKNDPEVVAHAMLDACKEYRGCFDQIHFAVVKKQRVNENYLVFEKIIQSGKETA